MKRQKLSLLLYLLAISSVSLGLSREFQEDDDPFKREAPIEPLNRLDLPEPGFDAPPTTTTHQGLSIASIPKGASFEKDNGYSLANEDAQQSGIPEKVVEGGKDQSFTLFTIANTDIGVDYRKIPYRERYLWEKRDAPCHSFNLKVPDERAEKSSVTLCIFRPNLEFTDETKTFILNVGSEEITIPQQKIFGYVMDKPVSSVYGRIVDRFFYGEVSIYSEESKSTCIYVVEEINLLSRLMRNNQKTLKHMLMVMNGKAKEKMLLVYNAVVTKGASLIDFMEFTNPNDINRNPFIMLSTNHNSYICPGEPMMQVDENGQVELGSGVNKITVENDGSIRMLTEDKSYTFRPHGRTIITEGMNVRTLQEHEGSVAITAFTSTSIYDCVLPTPAFQPKRRGGYVCKVCVAVDDLFSKYYITKRAEIKESASNYLVRILDRVAWILRSLDLNEDKKSDNIGLDYDAQSLKWSYPDNDVEDLTEQDIEILFESLGGYDFSDCCLGIGYTMKNFPNSGFARRPTNPDKIIPSGVCAGKTGRIPNNLMIISANDKQGKYDPITEKQLIYLTANQIAGAFGAAPDGAGEDICDQFLDDHKQARHFLMWPDVLRNTTLKEQSLSSCSKKDIVKTLSTCRSSCFDVDRHPFCGNGIVEEGEECDCGSEYNCKLQTCCYSRIGQHPCRKSGVGCKSSGAPPRIVLEKGLTFLTISLLITISHITF